MLHLDELTWPELDALDRARTVIFIPFSPMEEHGPHLPIGTDLLMAQAFAEDIAAKLTERRADITSVLMPPVPLGTGTLPMRGSVNLTMDVVFDVARQIGSAFARDGFRTIVFTNGHLSAWHLIALENAAVWVSRRHRVQCVAPAARLAVNMMRGGDLAATLGDRLTPAALTDLQSAAHAGMLETSVMLRRHPALVRPNFVELPRLTHRAMLGWRGRTPGKWLGYLGNPALGDAAWGEAAVASLSQAGADLILRLMDEGRPAARAARLFPRVPFGLAMRRMGMLTVAALMGAGATLMASQIFARGSKGRG